MDKDVFTTGQAARICMVNSRTVSKWCENGQIEFYRVPGSRDRRITKKALLKFLRKHNLPIPSIVLDDKKPSSADITTIEELTKQRDAWKKACLMFKGLYFISTAGQQPIAHVLRTDWLDAMRLLAEAEEMTENYVPINIDDHSDNPTQEQPL